MFDEGLIVESTSFTIESYQILIVFSLFITFISNYHATGPTKREINTVEKFFYVKIFYVRAINSQNQLWIILVLTHPFI